MVFGPVKKSSENYRSSHRRSSVKKSVPKNFANFTRKHLCCGFFNKVADLLACTFIKKRFQRKFFLVNIRRFLRTIILKWYLRKWKLLMFFNESSHTLLTGKSKESIPKTFYIKRNTVQCKTLIQLFPSCKQNPTLPPTPPLPPPSELDLAGKINWLC